MKNDKRSALEAFRRRAKNFTIRATKIAVFAGSLTLTAGIGAALTDDDFLGSLYLSVATSDFVMDKIAAERSRNESGIPLKDYDDAHVPEAVLQRNPNIRVLDRDDFRTFPTLYWYATTRDGVHEKGYEGTQKNFASNLSLQFYMSILNNDGNATVLRPREDSSNSCLVLPIGRDLTAKNLLASFTGLAEEELRPLGTGMREALVSLIMRHELMHCNETYQDYQTVNRLGTRDGRLYLEGHADQVMMRNAIVDKGHDVKGLAVFYQARLLSEFGIMRYNQTVTDVIAKPFYLNSYNMLKTFERGESLHKGSLLSEMRYHRGVTAQITQKIQQYELQNPANKQVDLKVRIGNAFQHYLNQNFKDVTPDTASYMAQYLHSLESLAPSVAARIIEPKEQQPDGYLPESYKLLLDFSEGRITELPKWQGKKAYMSPKSIPMQRIPRHPTPKI